MKKDKKQTPAVFEYSSLSKANLLIGAKYKASLLELRTTYASLFMIQNGNYREEPDGIYVEMRAGELRDLIGANNGSFYKNLLPVAQSMTNRSLGIVSPETESFTFISLITIADYKDGVFTVIFNKKLKEHIISLKKEYTSLPQQYIMALDSAYAFRLYEILKKSCYYKKGYTGSRNGRFLINMSIAELKLDLGVVNSALDSVQKELVGKTNPDYEKAVAKSPEKLYENWGDFRKRCIESPIEEINEKTDIYVEYDTIRSGKGGKVHRIAFTVYVASLDEEHENNNIPVSLDSDGNAQIQISDQDKFLMYMEIFNMFDGYKLDISDIINICEVADYNINKIKAARAVLEQTNSNIDNVVGWIISAIKNEYKTVKKKPSISNINEREYDMDDLERKLLNND